MNGYHIQLHHFRDSVPETAPILTYKFPLTQTDYLNNIDVPVVHLPLSTIGALLINMEDLTLNVRAEVEAEENPRPHSNCSL